MNKESSQASHPSERTLIALHHNRLPNPEPVEDHVVLCEFCLDRLEEIADLVETLRIVNAAAAPKSMKAGG